MVTGAVLELAVGARQQRALPVLQAIIGIAMIRLRAMAWALSGAIKYVQPVSLTAQIRALHARPPSRGAAILKLTVLV